MTSNIASDAEEELDWGDCLTEGPLFYWHDEENEQLRNDCIEATRLNNKEKERKLAAKAAEKAAIAKTEAKAAEVAAEAEAVKAVKASEAAKVLKATEAVSIEKGRVHKASTATPAASAVESKSGKELAKASVSPKLVPAPIPTKSAWKLPSKKVMKKPAVLALLEPSAEAAAAKVKTMPETNSAKQLTKMNSVPSSADKTAVSEAASDQECKDVEGGWTVQTAKGRRTSNHYMAPPWTALRQQQSQASWPSLPAAEQRRPTGTLAFQQNRRPLMTSLRSSQISTVKVVDIPETSTKASIHRLVSEYSSEYADKIVSVEIKATPRGKIALVKFPEKEIADELTRGSGVQVTQLDHRRPANFKEVSVFENYF